VEYLKSSASATSQPALSLGKVKELPIPLPPLPEQRSIAAVLAKADRLRRLRRYALDLSESYQQAVFVEMFGDPVTNPMGWKIVSLEELGEAQGGLQLSSKRRNLELQRPYLRVANVFRDRLDLSEIKQIELTRDEFKRVKLQRGDRLIAEGHGNINEIGRSAVWDDSIADCVHQNHLIRVRPNTALASSTYLSRYINSSYGRHYFTNASNTTSGLNTISTSIVKDLPVLHAPLSLQQRFASIARRYERLRAQQREALRQAEHLFQTLLHKAFRGELGASVEEVEGDGEVAEELVQAQLELE
jgi:type I restriction enzyme S subunit